MHALALEHGPGREQPLAARARALMGLACRDLGDAEAAALELAESSRDPLDERALEQMVLGVSTWRYARSLEPLPEAVASGKEPLLIIGAIAGG